MLLHLVNNNENVVLNCYEIILNEKIQRGASNIHIYWNLNEVIPIKQTLLKLEATRSITIRQTNFPFFFKSDPIFIVLFIMALLSMCELLT